MEPGDWRSLVTRLEELVLAGSGADAFEATFALVVTRLAAEMGPGQDIFAAQQGDEDTAVAVVGLLSRVATRWPGIVDPHVLREFRPAQLAHCVRLLAPFSLADAGFEVLDGVFEQLATAASKGSKGQYFTPRHVVECCVRLADPQPHEHVLDPACGSGGFLIHSMRHVQRASPGLDPVAWSAAHVHGVDWDERATRVARALLLVAGGSCAGIQRMDALRRDPDGADAPLLPGLPDGGVDVLLTNPPFAGEVSDGQLRGRYELAQRRGRVERDVLFIERCVQLLRPGGRLVMVLPHNKLGGSRFRYVRRWLLERIRVVAAIGLPQAAFMPHTSQRTTVLFGIKRAGPATPAADESICFVISERGGKDRRGTPQIRAGAAAHGPAWTTLDHDLEQALTAIGDWRGAL
jgi:type I restriction enzyme M protein